MKPGSTYAKIEYRFIQQAPAIGSVNLAGTCLIVFSVDNRMKGSDRTYRYNISETVYFKDGSQISRKHTDIRHDKAAAMVYGCTRIPDINVLVGEWVIEALSDKKRVPHQWRRFVKDLSKGRAV